MDKFELLKNTKENVKARLCNNYLSGSLKMNPNFIRGSERKPKGQTKMKSQQHEP